MCGQAGDSQKWKKPRAGCTSRSVTQTKAGRSLPKVLGLAAVVVAGVGLAGVFGVRAWLPGYVMERVTEAAAERGVRLSRCELRYERDGFSVTRVILEGCHVAMDPPLEASGVIEHLDVALLNEQPQRAFISGANITVSGTPDWQEWQGQLGREAFEVTGQKNRVAWITDEGRPPALEVTDLQRLAPTEDWAGKLVLAEILDGTVRFGDKARVELRVRSLPANTLVAEVDPSKSVGHVRLELSEVPFLLFAGILFGNVPAELATTTASGSLKLDVPYGLNPAEPKGQFDFTLAGLNFPVPRELAGLVYDTSPHLSGSLTSNRTYTKFEVPKLNFETGALRMKGKASVEREDMRTRWLATLQGPLPCESIVAAAARVHLSGTPLGDELSAAAANISRRALKGSVNVMVAIDADSRDLAAAKVLKSVGLGCGLKPLPLPSLKDLPEILLKELPQLKDLGMGDLELNPEGKRPGLKLPDLQQLPQGLPKIEIPGLRLPRPTQTKPDEPKAE